MPGLDQMPGVKVQSQMSEVSGLRPEVKHQWSSFKTKNHRPVIQKTRGQSQTRGQMSRGQGSRFKAGGQWSEARGKSSEAKVQVQRP